MKVFIYATLISKRILEQALGEDHGKQLTAASLEGWRPALFAAYHDMWPTLERQRGMRAHGYTIDVTPQEFDKLKAWEERYYPLEVPTDRGVATTFIFQRPKPKFPWA
jgi:hypothetical protein